MRKIIIFISTLLAVAFFVSSLLYAYFGPVSKSEEIVIFIVPQDDTSFKIADSLSNQKLIKSKKGFEFLLDKFYKDVEIKSGGYKLNPSMNSWQVIKRITSKQDLLWVNIFFCPRKEQLGERLASILGWDDKKLNEWNNLYKGIGSDYYEGVYYPDTYLIPVDESPSQVAQRFINRFNEKFSPLEEDYIAKNIKWTTGVKIASLIAREAAGREDMKTISGVIWNRLNQNMRLQIDATMQYTLGKNENGSWWGNIDLEQKQKDSPYNSYRYSGLPPTPICSPNIEFIEAALNPEETDCIFYLHDKNRQIRCAKTYEEHKINIQKYLI